MNLKFKLEGKIVEIMTKVALWKIKPQKCKSHNTNYKKQNKKEMKMKNKLLFFVTL